MPSNTTFGPYTAIPVVDGVTPINMTFGNQIQTQAPDALYSFNPDVSGPFVHHGCSASGTVGTTTVTIASGSAYLTMSDGTIAKIAVTSTTQTTSAPSSTYHLYLQPDGTWYWNTSNSPAANSLAIANVTTNGSGQIATITDLRSSAVDAVPALGVVHQVNGLSVTATTDQIVASYTAVTDGWYRVSVQLMYSNSVLQKPSVNVHFFAFDAGSFATNYFRSAQDGQWYNGSQSSTTGNLQEIIFEPLTFRNKGGQAFNIHFQDPGGVPADLVSVLIERLS